MTKFRKVSNNYVFREFESGLSVEEVAKLRFKSVRMIKLGKRIPPECKRLMRITKGR